MAKKYKRKVIVYYGPSGHGKGLVDAMSAFGIKGPLLMKIFTQNFSYNSSKDICEEMKKYFQGDKSNQKQYFEISVEEIVAKGNDK